MGIVAAFGLYSGLVLVYSRIPLVMSEDHFLPSFLAKCNARGAPWRALLLSGLIYSCVVLVFKNLEELAAAAVVLYGGMVSFEITSFLVLRWREPKLNRPFRVAGGWTVAVVVSLLPIICVSTCTYYYVQEFGLWTVVGKPLVAMGVVPLLFPIAIFHRRSRLRSFKTISS